jgi:tetratricopeptide (TPR) repeat protein
MGVVYLAEDPRLNRQVAIKTIDLAVDDPGEREFLRHRLLRDARAAAALSHPNIVGVYDILEEGDTAYVVMEYVAGESLAERLKSGPRPDPETVVQMLRQMAGALDYTHSRGVIHRDIKPGNVMIDAEGTAKIMDFGIARISDTRTVTPTGMVMGTAEYMAPEQIKGEAVDGRADQFSLAAVAYQMMTGSTLFGQHTLATLTYKIVNEMPQPATARNAALPAAVDAVLAKALAKLPDARYSTCSEFVEALGEALSGRVPAPAPPAAAVAAAATNAYVPPGGTGGSGKRVWLSLGAGVLIAGGVLAFWQPWARAPAPKPMAATDTQHPAEAAKPVPVARADESKPPPAKPKGAPNFKETAKPKELPKPKETAKPEEPSNSEVGDHRVPEETALPFRRGQQQMKAGDYQGAIQSFTKAIALHPKNAQAYASRGSAHQRLEQNEAAVLDYSQAILLAPREAFAYAGRGVCLVRLRRDDDAFADFNRALELEPDLAAALNGRGGVYFRRRQYAQAMRDFNAAIRANPRFAQAYQNRARARQATGDTAGAAADLQTEQRLRGQEKD